jgi:hypothetical protein
MTEVSKLYTATIDLAKSVTWAIFQGSGQPADFDAALYQDTFFADGALNGIAVNIVPGSISSIHRGDSSFVRLFYNENANVVIPTDIDVSALNIRFVLEDETQANVLSIANGSIARTSTSFTVLIPNSITSQLKSFIWSLRTTTDDKVLVRGAMQVEYAAD